MIRIPSKRDAEGKAVEYSESFAGRVLSLRERNMRDDSDFIALVWDDAKGEPREIEYATTRFPTYDHGASIDADEATLAKYATWQAKQAAAAVAMRERELAKVKEIKASLPEKGRRVKMVNSRKVAKGLTGTVIWFGVSGFASPYRNRYAADRPRLSEFGLKTRALENAEDLIRDLSNHRVGVKLDVDGKVVWVSAKAVEVLKEEAVA